jgi:hypothetical protein
MLRDAGRRVIPPVFFARRDYSETGGFATMADVNGDGIPDIVVMTGFGLYTFLVFAEKRDELFLKAVNAQVSFTRDASGAVTGLVLHQNGRDIPAEKQK